MMKPTFTLLLALLLGLASCNKVETGKSLDDETTDRIRSLGLLDDSEIILKFYSNYEANLAGNFYTDKRIAHYWIDKNYPERSDTTYAFYADITNIDTVFTTPDTFAPYLLVTKKDGNTFKVYIEGKHAVMLDFYKGAMDEWKK